MIYDDTRFRITECRPTEIMIQRAETPWGSPFGFWGKVEGSPFATSTRAKSSKGRSFDRVMTKEETAGGRKDE